MASNPISNQTGKVKRDIVVRIPAGLAATTNVLLARFMRPVKIRSANLVVEDVGTSPVFTFKLDASAAEDVNKDPGLFADLSTATAISNTAGRRTNSPLTTAAGMDVVATGQLRAVLTRSSGTAGAWTIHVEYEEDLD